MPGKRIGLLLALFAVLACGGQKDPVAKEGVVDTSQSGGEQTGVYSPERLRIKLGPTEVLVNIGGDVAITVSEFNDRLKEFPVGDQAQGLLEARKETLFQMIDYKAVAREGLRRHHPEKALPSNETGNPYASERFLAESVISKSVAIPGLVSDEDAKAFVLQRGEAFEQLVGPLGSPEAKMIHAKILLLDQRWRAQVETWRNLEEIEIFENNLKDRGES